MLLRPLAIFVFAAVATLAAAFPAHADDDFAKRFVAVVPPVPAPHFIFQDDKGVEHDLKEYKGRFVLLNIWATWCGPCMQEMPSLNALQDKFDYHDLNIVAVSEDRNGVAAVRSFYNMHDLKRLPIFVDGAGEVPFAMHAGGLPTTILINPDGLEIARIEGEANWTSPEALAVLKAKIIR